MPDTAAQALRTWELSLVDSAWQGSEFEGRPGWEKARELGFDALDLFVGYDPAALSTDERERILSDVKDVGLPVRSLICTSLGLTDFNPAVQNFHINRCRNVLDLAAELGTASNLLYVPGEYMFQQKLLPPESEWEKLVEATKRVGSHADGLGLELAVELLPFEHAFIKDIDGMLRLLDETGLDNVKACLDISHLWLMRIEPDEVARLEGRIGHVHIADCDGVHHGDLPAGRGTTPFDEYLEAIKAAHFSGGASVELEFPENPSRMIAWVSEAYDASAALLAAAGVRSTTS